MSRPGVQRLAEEGRVQGLGEKGGVRSLAEEGGVDPAWGTAVSTWHGPKIDGGEEVTHLR